MREGAQGRLWSLDFTRMERKAKGGDSRIPVSPPSGAALPLPRAPSPLSLCSRTPFPALWGPRALLQPSPFFFPSRLPHFLRDPPSSRCPHPGPPSLPAARKPLYLANQAPRQKSGVSAGPC